MYEINTLYEYRHPNICGLIAHSIDGPARSLVFEYCANGTLFERLHDLEGAPLGEERRLDDLGRVDLPEPGPIDGPQDKSA